MSEKKNILWINLVKGFCVLGVYYVHVVSFYGYSIPKVADYIKPFYVNAFFFISGYLLFRKQFSPYIAAKSVTEYIKTDGKIYLENLLFRLVIPSVIFSAAIYLPSYLLRNRPISAIDFFMKTVGGCTYWFTSALVVAEVLIFVLLLLRCKSFLIYLLTASGLIILGYVLDVNQCVLIYPYSGFPWEYKQGFEAMIFLVAGGMYWKYEQKIDKYFRNKFVVLAFVLFYMIVFTIWPDRIKVLLSTSQINVVGVLMSIYASVMLILLCKLISKAPILDYLGKNSLVFYFLSGSMPIVGSMIAGRLIPEKNFAVFMVVYLFSLLGSWVASWIINKYMSWLLDFRRIVCQ